MTLQHGPHVSVLHQLTALTHLNVTLSITSIPALQQSLKGLAAVTQLQNLSVALDSRDLTVASLLPLTSLTALTSFSCENDPGSWELHYTSTQVSTTPALHLHYTSTKVVVLVGYKPAAVPGRGSLPEALTPLHRGHL